MPATAALDNETLDHLLSVVNDGRNIGHAPRFGRCIRPAPAKPARRQIVYRPNSRIAPSSPSIVSGYIRPPMSWRIRRIEAVVSHSRSAMGLSQTQDG